jgi:NADP-dependent 3-hydroxy acid dehydrogenase YdfG
VVAITGAGRGIGAATARLLAARGARVVLGSRSEKELAATADASGGEVAYQSIDVTQPQDLRTLVDLAAQRFGRLDVLASIAGVAINAPLNSGELDDWNQMIDVNLRGVLHGIAAALPVFRTQGSGHFITVTSTAASKWVPGQAVYAATKSAVRAWARSCDRN